jgi:hypothetical protein
LLSVQALPDYFVAASKSRARRDTPARPNLRLVRRAPPFRQGLADGSLYDVGDVMIMALEQIRENESQNIGDKDRDHHPENRLIRPKAKNDAHRREVDEKERVRIVGK